MLNSLLRWNLWKESITMSESRGHPITLTDGLAYALMLLVPHSRQHWLRTSFFTDPWTRQTQASPWIWLSISARRYCGLLESITSLKLIRIGEYYKATYLENYIIDHASLERIQGYLDIEHEPKPTEAGIPPAAWPKSGELQVQHLSARYSMVWHYSWYQILWNWSLYLGWS